MIGFKRYNIKKNKGSVLVIFLIFFSILIIIGTSITSLSLSTLKVAKFQEIIDKNVYTAESGMDIVHEELLKLVEKAYEEGEKTIDNRIQESMVMGEVIRNDEFKEEFKKIFEDYINKNITKELSKGQCKLQFNVNRNLPKKIRVKISKLKGDKFGINAISKFKENKIKKEVSVDFEIIPPEFSKVIMYRNPVWNNPLTSDKNIEINSKDGLSIYGNIYARGIENKAIKKKGIIINTEGISNGCENSGNTVNIKGNLITNENMYIENYNKFIKVEGKFYGRNILNQNKTFGNKDSQSITFENGVYLLDDMEINSKGTRMIFNGGVFAVSSGDKSKYHNNSSSIIINGDNNHITINKKLYIAGTSYIPKLYTENNRGIRVQKDYQTGESISIKGNYLIYTDFIERDHSNNQKYKMYYMREDSREEDDIVYKLYEYQVPLKDGRINSAKVSNKKLRFEEFINQNYNNGSSNIVGYDFIKGNIVELEDGIDIYGLGSITKIMGSKIEPQNTGGIEDEIKKVKPKEFELKKNIYSLGNPHVYMVSKKDTAIKINDLVDLKNQNLFKIYKDNPERENEEEKVIIINSKNDPITITENSIRVGRKSQMHTHGKLKCFIISKGPVSIENAKKLEITGTIISKGNISLNNSSTLNIRYDRDTVESIIGKYYTEISSIFKQNDKFKKELIVTRDNTINIAFATKDFVKRKNWSVK